MVKNTKDSFYRVNNSVVFSNEWFDYVVSSPLPSYFRIIPIVFQFDTGVSLETLLDYLSVNFSFCCIDKYFPENRAFIRVVTSKSIGEFVRVINDFNCKFGKCVIY